MRRHAYGLKDCHAVGEYPGARRSAQPISFSGEIERAEPRGAPQASQEGRIYP
jgi:hypothetical protein